MCPGLLCFVSNLYEASSSLLAPSRVNQQREPGILEVLWPGGSSRVQHNNTSSISVVLELKEKIQHFIVRAPNTRAKALCCTNIRDTRTLETLCVLIFSLRSFVHLELFLPALRTTIADNVSPPHTKVIVV